VAQVSIGGEQKPAVRIQVDPAKLAAAGLTLEDMRGVVSLATTNAAKGTLNGAQQSFTIAANDQLSHAAEYDNVVLAYRNGAPIRVSDVGSAMDGPENTNIAAWSGTNRSVLLIVSKQPGANVIDTVDQIKASLPRINSAIPAGLKIETILDRTQTIRASVADVQFTLALTCALVVLVILLFLRNLVATIIPSVAVPLSLLGAVALMYPLGFSLDNLSLMALTISVGFIADDAIVVVENIYRHLEGDKSRVEAALQGAREIGFTVFSISVSLVAVFIPLLFMGGNPGHRGLHGRVFDANAHALFALYASGIGASRPHPARHRMGLQMHNRNLSAIARYGPALPSRDPGGVLHHAGGDRRAGCRNSEGLFSDTGHRSHHRTFASRAGRFAGQDAAVAAGAGRDCRSRSRRSVLRIGYWRRRCANSQHRAILHPAQTDW
jgi:multidrug efflux pump subunit AcrB